MELIIETKGIKSLIVGIATILFGLPAGYAQAQNASDTITIKRTFWGTFYWQNNQKIRLKAMQRMMQPFPEAAKHIKRARVSKILENIMGVTAGGLIGWSLGAIIVGDDLQWFILGPGLGGYGATIGFTIYGNRKAKNAVKIYNNNL